MAVLTVEEAITKLGAEGADDLVFVEMMEDIASYVEDTSKLDKLPITDLRILAHQLGVSEPMAKTQDEIIAEVRWIIENEELYQQVIL